VEGLLGRHFGDEVDLLGIDERLVLVRIVLLADGDACQRAALLSQVGDDGTRVDAGDGGDALARAPLSQRLHGGPVRVLLGMVGDNDSGGLDVRGFKVLQQAGIVTGITGGDSVVADERLGEDQDLAAVGGVGHGLGVADERGGEDGFAGDGLAGAERGAVVDGTSLYLSEQARIVRRETNTNGEGSTVLDGPGSALAGSTLDDGSERPVLEGGLKGLGEYVTREHFEQSSD
jgi:hypothetical protein